jgi:hypothetical protein
MLVEGCFVEGTDLVVRDTMIEVQVLYVVSTYAL